MNATYVPSLMHIKGKKSILTLFWDACEKGNDHLCKAKEAGDEKTYENSVDTDIFTSDMQKVILLHKLTSKEQFFTSCFVVFNETFATLTDGPDLLVLWHEGIAGRNANHVASAYVKCVSA